MLHRFRQLRQELVEVLTEGRLDRLICGGMPVHEIVVGRGVVAPERLKLERLKKLLELGNTAFLYAVCEKLGERLVPFHGAQDGLAEHGVNMEYGPTESVILYYCVGCAGVYLDRCQAVSTTLKYTHRTRPQCVACAALTLVVSQSLVALM